MYPYIYSRHEKKKQKKANIALNQSSTRAPDARAAPGHAERYEYHGEKHQRSPGRELGRIKKKRNQKHQKKKDPEIQKKKKPKSTNSAKNIQEYARTHKNIRTNTYKSTQQICIQKHRKYIQKTYAQYTYKRHTKSHTKNIKNTYRKTRKNTRKHIQKDTKTYEDQHKNI